jgi:tRNA threonylcarbamoyladenosine biosynthesis protein TsaE
MQIQIRNTDELPLAARQFISAMGTHRVFAFYGGMGAGKTTFIRAICEELGVQETVTSPTFAIVNEYRINDGSRQKTDENAGLSGNIHPSAPHQSSIIKKVFHFDFYRIRRLSEAYDMGFEDYLYSGHLCFIEWPELVEELLPEDAVCVNIQEDTTDHTRTVTIES